MKGYTPSCSSKSGRFDQTETAAQRYRNYFSRLCHPSPQEEPGKGWSIQSLPCVDSTSNRARMNAPPALRGTVTLYFSRLLKISRCTNLNWPHPPVKNQSQISPLPDYLGYGLSFGCGPSSMHCLATSPFSTPPGPGARATATLHVWWR